MRLLRKIMDNHSLALALQGADVVINCIRDHADGATIKGTERLLKSARAVGVKRIVHMSSIAVYGNNVGVVTEERTKAPTDRYGQEKDAAEELCRSAAGSDLTIAIVRPALVYGPFGEEWTARFIREIAAGSLQQLGPAGEGEANLIFAGDLGEFVAQLAIADLPPFSVYNANGAEIPSFDAYFDQLSQAMGQGPLPPASKGPLELSVRRQLRRIARFLVRTQRPWIRRLTRGSRISRSALERVEKFFFDYDVRDEPFHRFSRRVVYSNDLAQEIGFEPATLLEDGVKASVEWAKSEQLVPAENVCEAKAKASYSNGDDRRFYQIEYYRKTKSVGTTMWRSAFEEAKDVASAGLALHYADYVEITDIDADRAQIWCYRIKEPKKFWRRAG
jgi:nucleoside-diphosphate-sugar epimerase